MGITTSTNFTVLPDEESLIIPSFYKGEGFISQGLFKISDQGVLNTFSIKNGAAYSPVLDKNFLKSMNKRINKQRLAGLNGGEVITTERIVNINNTINAIKNSEIDMEKEIKKFSLARKDADRYSKENSMLKTASKGYIPKEEANALMRKEATANTDVLDRFISRYTRALLDRESLSSEFNNPNISDQAKRELLSNLSEVSYDVINMKPGENLLSIDRLKHMPSGATDRASNDIKDSILAAVQQGLKLGHSHDDILNGLTSDTEFKNSLTEIAKSKLDIADFQSIEFGDQTYSLDFNEKKPYKSDTEEGKFIQKAISEYEQKVKRNSNSYYEANLETKRIEGKIKREKDALMSGSTIMSKERIEEELQSIDEKYRPTLNKMKKTIDSHDSMVGILNDINSGNPSESTIETITESYKSSHISKLSREKNELINTQKNKNIDEAYAELTGAMNSVMSDGTLESPIYATYKNGSVASNAMLEIEDENARSLFQAIYQEGADGTYSNQEYLTTFPIQNDDGSMTRLAINDIEGFDKNVARTYLSEVSSDEIIGNEHRYLTHTVNGEKVNTPIDTLYKKAVDYRKRVGKLDESGKATLYSEAAREYSKAPIDIKRASEGGQVLKTPEAPHGRRISLTDREISLLGGEEAAKKITDITSIFEPKEKALGDSRYIAPKAVGENVRFIDNILEPMFNGDNSALRDKATELQSRFNAVARLENNITEGNYAKIGAAIDSSAEGTFSRLYKGILQHTDIDIDTKFGMLPTELQVDIADRMHKAMIKDIDYGINGLITTAYSQKFDVEKLKTKKQLLEHQRSFFESQLEYVNMYERGSTGGDPGITGDSTKVVSADEANNAKKVREIEEELERTADAIKVQGISVSEADRRIVDRIGKKDFEGLKLITGDSYETLNIKKLGRNLTRDELNTGIVSYNEVDMAIENFDSYHQLMSIEEIRGGKAGSLSFTNEEWDSGVVSFEGSSFKTSQFYEYYNMDNRIAQVEYSDTVRKQGLRSIADVNTDIQYAVANATEDITYNKRTTIKGELIEKSKYISKDNDKLSSSIMFQPTKDGDGTMSFFNKFEMDGDFGVEKVGSGNFVLAFPESPTRGFTDKIIRERKFRKTEEVSVGQVPLFMDGGSLSKQLPLSKRTKTKAIEFLQEAEQIDPLNMVIGYNESGEAIRGAITIDNYKDVADIYGVDKSKIEGIVRSASLESQSIKKRDTSWNPRRKETAKDLDSETTNYLKKKFNVDDLGEVSKVEHVREIQAHLERLRKQDVADRAAITGNDHLEFERYKEFEGMVSNSQSDTVKMAVKKEPDTKMTALFVDAMKENKELVIDSDAVNYTVDGVQDGMVRLTSNHVAIDDVQFGFKYDGDGTLSEQFFKLDDALYERGRNNSAEIKNAKIATMDLDKVAFDAMIDGESTPISKRTLLEWMQNDTVMENGIKTSRIGSQLSKEQFTWITNSGEKLRDVNGTTYLAIAQTLDSMEETGIIKILEDAKITSKELANGISKKEVVEALSNGMAHTVKVNMLVNTVNPNGDATDALDTAMRVASAYVKNDGKEVTADNLADALSHMKNSLGTSSDEIKQYFSTINDITYDQILEHQKRNPDIGGIDTLTDATDMFDITPSSQRRLDNWSKYKAELANQEAYLEGLSTTHLDILQGLKDKMTVEALDKGNSMTSVLNKNNMLENRIVKTSDKLNNIRKSQFSTHNGSIAREEVGQALEMIFGNVESQSHLNVEVRNVIKSGLTPSENGSAAMINYILNNTGDTPTITSKRLATLVTEYTEGKTSKEIFKSKYTTEAALKMRFDALQEFHDKRGINATMDLIKDSADGDFVKGLTGILGDENYTFKTIDEALSTLKVGDLQSLEQYTFLTKYVGGLELTGAFERNGKNETMKFGDYKSLNKRVSPIGVTSDGEKIRVVQNTADATMTRSIASFRSGQVNVAKKNVTKGQYSGSINTDTGLALMTSTKFSYKNASSRPYGSTAKIDPITSITNLNRAINTGATVGTWDFETTGLPDKLNKDVFKPVEFSFTPGKFNSEGKLVQTGDNITKYLAPPKAVRDQFKIAQIMARDGGFDSLFTDNAKLSKIGGDSAMYGLLHNYAKYDNTSINVGGTETTVGKFLGSKMQVKDGIVFANIDGSTINTGKSVSDVVGILSESSLGVANHLLSPGKEAKYGIDASQVFHKEREFMDFAYSTLGTTDYNAGHNISGFDLPAIERWMTDGNIVGNPKELFDNSIDTLTLAKMQNPGRNSNSQEHLTRNLNIPKNGMAHLASYDVEANMVLLNDIISNDNIKTMMADSTEIIKPTDYIYNKHDAKIGMQGLGTGVFQILGLEKDKLTVRNALDDTIKEVDVTSIASLKKAAADGWTNFGDNKDLAMQTLSIHARQDAGRTLDNAVGNGMWDRYLQYGDKSSLDRSKEVLNKLKMVYEKQVDDVASQLANGSTVERFTAPVMKDIEAIAMANAAKLTGVGYTNEISHLEDIAKNRTPELQMFKEYSQTSEGRMVKDYANAARIRKDANIYDAKTYENFTSELSTLIGNFKTQAVADGKLSKDALITVPDVITLGTVSTSTFDSPSYKGSARLKGLKDFEFNINMTSAESIEDSILKASGRLGNHMLNMHGVASKEQGTSVALNSFILPYLSEKGMVSNPELKDAIAKAALNSNSTTYSDYKNAALILASDMMTNKESIINSADPLQIIDKIFAITDEELLDGLDEQIAELMKITDTTAMSVNRYEIDEATGKSIIKESVLPDNAHEAIERVVNSISSNEKQHMENLSLLTGTDLEYDALPRLNLSPVTSNSDLDDVIRRIAPDAEYMHDANNPWMQWKKANDLKDVAVNLDTGVSMEEFKSARRHVINSMSEGKTADAVRYRNSMPEVFDIIEKALGTSMMDKSYIEKLNQDTVANSHVRKYINDNNARWNKNRYDKSDILKHLARRANMADEAAPISGHISDELINNNKTKYEAMKAIGMLQQDADGKWFTGSIGFGDGMLNPNKVIMTTNVGRNIGKPMSTLPIEALENLAVAENVSKGQKSAVANYLHTLSKQDGLSNAFRRNYNTDAEQRLVDYLNGQTSKYDSLEEAIPSAVEKLNKNVKEKGKKAASKNAHSASGDDVKKIIRSNAYEPKYTSLADNTTYQSAKAGIKKASKAIKTVSGEIFSSGGAKLGAAAIAFAGALALTRQFTSDGGQRNADGSAIDNQARIVDEDLHKEYNGINRSPFNPQQTVRLEGEGQGLNISARARNNGSANNVNIDNVLKDSIGSSLSADVNIRHSDDRSTINQEYVQGLFSNALR